MGVPELPLRPSAGGYETLPVGCQKVFKRRSSRLERRGLALEASRSQGSILASARLLNAAFGRSIFSLCTPWSPA